MRFYVLHGTRRLGRSKSAALGVGRPTSAIGRIYVINLDRKPDRWRHIKQELQRVRDEAGDPLFNLTRRLSAVDARYLKHLPDDDVLQHHYSLADQLFVQPHPLLAGNREVGARQIQMTRQEVAVALSHIEAWRLIAAGDPAYTLVLEDDAYFTRGFARILEGAWREAMERTGQGGRFDMLYLSYMEAGTNLPKTQVSDLLFTPVTGLWQLSGYVLSREGAQKLLDLLPVRGPVDLWMNHQFHHLDVIATRQSIIEQRLDAASTNSYSALPVLAQVGAVTREKPLVAKSTALPGPVFAFGKSGSGLTALATALSTLGYRCCSDVTDLPVNEKAHLFNGRRDRLFSAYVNVGSLDARSLTTLAKLHRNAHFIWAVDGENPTAGKTDCTPGGTLSPKAGTDGGWHAAVAEQLSVKEGARTLVLPHEHRDKWELLCSFLRCEYPSHPYPECEDRPLREHVDNTGTSRNSPPPGTTWLKRDSSPWVIARKDGDGVPLAPTHLFPKNTVELTDIVADVGNLDGSVWFLRDDTFPSNLALFRPNNFTACGDRTATLTLREEDSSVRNYTSASVATRARYLCGRFSAEVMPSNIPGLITGIFLHRNTPRQEIDIEFLGKDTTKMLTNVYYNPGQEGTKLEYGYRGSPALIDLGFDASEEFHLYEIEWCQDWIRWRVDGRLVHERVQWGPTPIPNQPMEFNVNLWHSRSTELAGRLDSHRLPALTQVRELRIRQSGVGE
jgi:GR25 family glycosyltransferase involved in LPS biosynthesis